MAGMDVMRLDAINPGQIEMVLRKNPGMTIVSSLVRHSLISIIKKDSPSDMAFINQAITSDNDVCGGFVWAAADVHNGAIKGEICQMSSNNKQTVLLKAINDQKLEGTSLHTPPPHPTPLTFGLSVTGFD